MITQQNVNLVEAFASSLVQNCQMSASDFREIKNALRSKIKLPIEKEELLTMTELTQKLKVSRPTIYKQINDGKLKQRKVGRQNRFLLSEIMTMLAG